MEHFFKTIDGWFDYEDLYQMVVDQYGDGSHFVEMGTWKGRSAAYMGVAIINSGKQILFDTIDHFIGIDKVTGSLEQKRKMLANYKNCLRNLHPTPLTRIIPLPSADAALLYDNRSLDFVFIDGDHAYAAAYNDIKTWMPKVKIGGILAGHDFTSHAGVNKAVKTLLPKAALVSKRCWMIKIKLP
jgi:hypothetical protein